MAITRIERNGHWIEKADTPEDARKLHEKHGPDLQRHGVEDFDRKFKKDLAEGFEQIADPNGNKTFVRRDKMEQALQQGYGRAPTKSIFTVPALPWHKDKFAEDN